MEINLSAFSTSDLISSINVIATVTFSFLVWRATVASNKTAIAIKVASEKEKREISEQNRFIINYNLLKVKDTLFSHTFEGGFSKEFAMEIENITLSIKKFELTSYYNSKEIKEILSLVDYIENSFLIEVKKQRVYELQVVPGDNNLGVNLEFNNEGFIVTEKELIKECLNKVNELLKFLND